VRIRYLLAVSFLLQAIIPFYLYNYILFSPLNCRWSMQNATSNRIVLVADPQMEGDARVARQGAYGQFHNSFNDWYFWLIQNNVNRNLKPSRQYVLGDLFSSQYISDEEFRRRLERYHQIFTSVGNTRLISLVGNHDAGYGAEIVLFPHRLTRFVSVFGPQEQIEELGDHWLVQVNSLILDNYPWREKNNPAWTFLHELANNRSIVSDENRKKKPILLFTHIPLYKENGICVDKFKLKRWNGNVQEQTMLSPETSKFILDKIQPSFIFNGHDHYGCSYIHNNTAKTMEYTLRSIMGDYGGYIGLFEYGKLGPNYSYNFKTCTFFHTKYILSWMIITALWTIFIILYSFLKLLRKLFGSQKKKKE
jgi:hypothetical protein